MLEDIFQTNFSNSVILKTVTYELSLMKHSICLLREILLASKKHKNKAKKWKYENEEPLPSL